MERKGFLIQSSPHIKSKDTVNSIMYSVVIALLPATLFGIYFFGPNALVLVVLGVVTAILTEFAVLYIRFHDPASAWKRALDGSALLTGLLLALNLPPLAPWWTAVVGSFVAIFLGKQIYGGLGQNIFNPALVGRVFLFLSFPAIMANYAYKTWGGEVVTEATPLTMLKLDGVHAALQHYSYSKCFLGFIGGTIGETSALLLILGGIYLLIRGIISWHIPVTYGVTLFVLTGIFYLIDPSKYADPVFHLLTGGFMLGAIFMATDMVTCPITKKGQIIFGIGLGFLTFVIRLFGSYPEGVSFSILLMNALVPLINKYTLPEKFGAKRGEK